MTNSSRRGASALLLTVMIIAILTTTTLSSITVRFDQLAATDKVVNSAVAKSAADSALIKVKEKLATLKPIEPKIFDLDSNSESDLPPAVPFRPNPRKIVSTYQKVSSSLPRCLAVVVLSPWTNAGQYLFGESNESNPAFIFYYANIVNDTPLGIIPGNNALGGGGDSADKQKTISQLTNMGHFYNPFAPVGGKQNNLSYWTVKLGGPRDQFLTRKATDGISSFYKNADFLYLPSLPRWSDSGLFTPTPGTGVDRISATDLRSKFESTVKDNNFRVWIDASVSDAQLYEYGFGDLFVDSSDYKLKWLQPALWNDSPEADNFSTPYKSANAEASTLEWSKQNQPLLTSADNGWSTAIVKGARSFSFIKVLGNPSFSPSAEITGLIYGSLEGLRLNQAITLLLLDKNQQPLTLQSRGQDQGRLYAVRLTAIGPITLSNGVETINVRFRLSSDSFDTPLKSTGGVATGTDIETIGVLAGPQYSTANSINSVRIAAPSGGNTTITLDSGCLTACPAVGDLISLTKPSSKPVWGKVTGVTHTNNGTTLGAFAVDKLRQSPLPTREMAYTYFEQNGPKIAYYGGAVLMNDYDGGYASESNQLWIYDPEADSWTFPPQTDGILPGRRAGASMVYDSINKRLVMIGGYFHEAVSTAGAVNCETAQTTCLYTNRPGLRIAKRVTNDVFAYKFESDPKDNSWDKLDFTPPPAGIVQNTAYTLRVTSTLADRSGLERWKMMAKNPPGQAQTLNLDGSTSSVKLDPSAAGVARGDSAYLYGNKTDSSSFYAWAKIDSVDYPADSVKLTIYGNQTVSDQSSVEMKTLAIQVLSRAPTGSSCVGIKDGNFDYCQFSSDNNSAGYAVGDSVVLEQFTSDSSALQNTLSGFISFMDGAKVYFVADERNAAIKDFSDQSVGKVAARHSALAVPSARYGAAFALQPTDSKRASYWQGAAKNVNYSARFADLWTVQFEPGDQGNGGALWSFQPTANSINSGELKKDGSYNFQVVRPNYLYQIATSKNTAGGVNPEIIKSTLTDPKTGVETTSWNNAKNWKLEIDPNDGGKAVVGAWATLERRTSDGIRETFHGIVENTYVNTPSGCAAYTDGRELCLRHNPAYPNDSGLNTDSTAIKVTMNPSFRTDIISSGRSKGVLVAGGFIALQTDGSSDYGTVPGVGAIVLLWRNGGVFPRDAYTFVVNRRSFNGATKTFNYYFDRLIASPHTFGYSTSQIASSAGVDRLVTITDHQMNYYDDTNAPEWVKDATNGAWKIRLAAKNPEILYRPAARRAGATASIHENGATKLFIAGGSFGQFGSLWKQDNAGATATDAAVWKSQYVSADLAKDIPNLFGGSLVVYKSSGNIRAVYFGGKQKTDLSSADYGSWIGAKILGRPDVGTLKDNSFFITDSIGSNDPSAVALTNTIESNSSGWPNGVANSLQFKGGDRGSGNVCSYLGQVGCSSKHLLSQLGDLGRLDDSTANDPSNGWTWGKSALLTELGDRFKSQADRPSLIMSVPTLSGSGVNGRWEQDGYRPYLNDTSTFGSTYGKLSSNFGSNKTAALVAYSALNNAEHKGGAILVTSVGVGAAIAGSRGGSTGAAAGWHSYCAASEIKKDTNGPVLLDGLYQCQSSASRYLSNLPDAEDLLFMLNAAQALGAANTYKVVGYYGGVKRGYLVTSISGTLPNVYEIVP